MSIWNNINGVWREVWSTHVKVNGVWRESDVLTKVNGVWRESYNHLLEEKDIIGFRIVYKRSYTKKHLDFPNLSYNPNIPVSVHLAGDSIESMDTHSKSIIFEYFREQANEEGILMYEGNLYAVLVNGQIINVGNSISSSDDNRVNENISEIWNTDKLNTLSIQLQGYVMYDYNGYYMNGWNSLFSTEQFLDCINHPDQNNHKNIYRLNTCILPIESRSETFSSISSIGIARDMTSKENNMIGSYGVLDHTIEFIYVNNVAKPFVIELYD